MEFLCLNGFCLAHFYDDPFKKYSAKLKAAINEKLNDDSIELSDELDKLLVKNLGNLISIIDMEGSRMRQELIKLKANMSAHLKLIRPLNEPGMSTATATAANIVNTANRQRVRSLLPALFMSTINFAYYSTISFKNIENLEDNYCKLRLKFDVISQSQHESHLSFVEELLKQVLFKIPILLFFKRGFLFNKQQVECKLNKLAKNKSRPKKHSSNDVY
jgi:hypothetical protein